MATTTTDILGGLQVDRRARWASTVQRQGAFLALLATFGFGWLRYGENGFTSQYNLYEALRYNAMFGLIALGMTFVIMTGGIDLSVGAVAVLASVVAAQQSDHGLFLGTLAGVGIGLAVGLLNGGIIAGFGIQPFVVTLATLLGGRGLALLLADNTSVGIAFESNFKALGLNNWQIGPESWEWGRIPIPAVVMVVAFVLGSVLLNFTRFGRHVLAQGGNEEAARLAGLPVFRTTVAVYALCGALSGLSGAILAAQTFTGNPTEAVGWELSAIAAVVVGGTLLTGGLGSVGTTLVGVLLLGLIINMLNFESLDPYWQFVIRGLFLLVVVILQSKLTRRQVLA